MHLAPRWVRSDADGAVYLAAKCGLTADPWQTSVLESWMGRDRAGRWSAGTCGLAVPRQNGKNAIIEIRELFGMVWLGESFLHTAHQVKTARKAFKRLKWFFGEKANDPGAKFPELNALVVEVRNTNGQEAILLSNGGGVEFVARSRGSARGFTVDVLVLDEAQDLTDDELEALLPTISAAPLGDPQVILTGTPPNEDLNQTGEVFARVRKEGEQRADKRLAWDDFGVADGPCPDINDRRLWFDSNPALGGRLNVAEVQRELRMMSPEGFARERLGWWGTGADKASGSPISIDAWGDCEDPDPAAAPELMGAFAVEIDLGYEWASIGAAGARPDGRMHVELVSRDRGTRWITGRCVELDAKHGPAPFVIDTGGPGAMLVEPLQAAGLDVVTAKTADVAEACAGMAAAVDEHMVAHGPQPELAAAVAGARKRPFRDGGWSLGRKASDVDVTPLMAVILARWAASKTPSTPTVWSIRELVEQIQKDRGDASADEPVPPVDGTRPDGSVFHRF